MAFWNTESRRALMTCRVGAGRLGAMRLGFSPKDTDGGPGGAATGPFYVWRRFIPSSFDGDDAQIVLVNGSLGIQVSGNIITIADYTNVGVNCIVGVLSPTGYFTPAFSAAFFQGTDWFAKNSNAFTASSLFEAMKGVPEIRVIAATPALGSNRLQVFLRPEMFTWESFKK